MQEGSREPPRQAPGSGPSPHASSSPELTVAAVILGAALAALLGAANAYLGLFAGITVSASIPAAVVSMAALKVLRGTILENNAVQTAASAGEAVAGGVIFTLPALLIMGVWTEFSPFQTATLAALGGLLGVVFTVFIARALLDDPELRFPEGVATAEVLRAGHLGGQVAPLVWGSIIGAGIKLAQVAGWLSAKTQAAFHVSSWVAYGGLQLSAALLAVGAIVGRRVSFLIFAGGALNWWVATPLVIIFGANVEGSALEQLNLVWFEKTRYLGVGAMLVGGLWTIVDLRHRFSSFIKAGAGRRSILGLGGLGVAVFGLVAWSYPLGYAALAALLIATAGFLFSAVTGYMSGLVGSSNNPVSGVTLATVLVAAVLFALLGAGAHVGPALTIVVGCAVATAAAIAGDTLQDLKAGRILGATPWRQQVMQTIGVLAAALVVGPVLNVLAVRYGFGMATEAHPNPLSAPQATLMAAVARGVFDGALPWGMVSLGAAAGAVLIIIDQVQRRRGSEFRIPVLAVAVGSYLPLSLSAPIFIGGLLVGGRTKLPQATLLIAAGLVTGEALSGIAAAFVSTGASTQSTVAPTLLGALAFGFVALFLRRSLRK